ncbi:HIT family protein [Macrococcus bovicus]|uniref:HIT family protein n=1 Tax=Macrococcus bovicus TaxID=69968 RepID=A0A4R6C2I8_9STAP|nr:HIT family protein [Macrococcus bovicus]TDM15333.1 HIT family protein [Macrococcus bovicus]
MPSETCIFCHHLKKEQILMTSHYFKVVFDIDPIQYGHLLIISKRHVMNYCDLLTEEVSDIADLQKELITLLEREVGVGVTVVFNNGKMMDQNTHFHVHLIPRYVKDNFWNGIHVEKHDSQITRRIEMLLKKDRR